MPGKIVSFPKFRNFQITDKRLTLQNNQGHFRTQRTIKHQETPTNQNKKNKTKNLLPSDTGTFAFAILSYVTPTS